MITQSFSTKARDFFKSMLNVDMEIKQREGWAETKFNMLAENYSEYSRLLKQQVRDADLILCATPSTQPLFHHEILTKPNGRLKARLIIAVGSYTKNMIELPPEIIQQAIKIHGHGQHIRKRAEEGGVILVDNATCLAETGELTRAGLEPRHVVEVGEILMLDDQFAHELDNDDDDTTAVEDDESAVRSSIDGLGLRSSLANALGNVEAPSRATSRSSSFSSLSRRSSSLLGHRRSKSDLSKLTAAVDRRESKDGQQMSRWLSKGNVIYKSVGLGLMDLCVGAQIVRLAREKGVGTTFKDF
jgi:ornithine cyclodeaminase/alanine dehydrogenase-like protein (mu-crystallin family)